MREARPLPSPSPPPPPSPSDEDWFHTDVAVYSGSLAAHDGGPHSAWLPPRRMDSTSVMCLLSQTPGVITTTDCMLNTGRNNTPSSPYGWLPHSRSKQKGQTVSGAVHGHPLFPSSDIGVHGSNLGNGVGLANPKPLVSCIKRSVSRRLYSPLADPRFYFSTSFLAMYFANKG